VIIQLAEGRWGSGTLRKRVWRKTQLDHYKGNVPEFVLSRALEIKREAPETSFEVMSLVQETTNKAPEPLPDPFLIARHGNETYFIDVWDEKEYEKEL